MDYYDKVHNAKNLNELFEVWKNKEPVPTDYTKDGKKVNIVINHRENVFIADGIVNEDIWNSGQYKKILFVLKEARGDDWDDECTLVTWLKDDNPTINIWSRVARWVYGIQNTTADFIPRYKPNLSSEEHSGALEQIAVMNIKKSNGQSQSEYAEIDAYAEKDCEELKKEFALIDPDIVICGSTFKTLRAKVFDRELQDIDKSDNWYYYLNLDGKERLFIDSYHPANRWPDLMNYYTITNIYQQALKEKIEK